MKHREFAYLKFIPEKQSKSSTGRAVFMLHGVPGTLSRRNEDLGQRLCEHFGITVYLLHYRGLGSNPGLFSFSSTLDQAMAAFAAIQSEASEWILIGHSWGALVTAALATGLDPELVSRVVLMSPFNFIPEVSALERILGALKVENPETFAHLSVEDMVAELEDIRRHNNPRTNLCALALPKEKLFIVQAMRDDVVPVRTTEELVELLKHQVNYSILDDDHSFLSDRAQFISHIISVLES